MRKAGRPKDERVLDLPLDRILEPEVAVRTAINRERLDALKRSIQQVGLIQPIVVKPRGDRFEIIVGHRRYIAHKELKLATIRALAVDGKDDLGDEVRKMHENTEREEVNPLDEARFLLRLGSSYKLSQKEIAQRIGRSDAYVSQRLAIMDAPPLIQEALEDGVISFSVARELAMITDEQELKTMVNYAIANGVTPAVAKSWRMQWESAAAMKEAHPELEPPPVIYEVEDIVPQFTCDICRKKESTAKLKLLRLCPGCERELKTATSEPS